MQKLLLITLICLFFSCKEESKQKELKITEPKVSEEIVLSESHTINRLVCDLDGDGLNETVEIVRNQTNKKSGLRVVFGNGKRTDYFGMGKEILGQGFDEIDWAGVFEVAPKNKKYWNNVNDDGEILKEEEIKEEDKILLQNDAIFLHQVESCGGGIIYFKNGKYQWIQQE